MSLLGCAVSDGPEGDNGAASRLSRENFPIGLARRRDPAWPGDVGGDGGLGVQPRGGRRSAHLGCAAIRPYVVRETRPGTERSTESDLLDYVRHSTQTSWHVAGTCRMGADEASVVDEKLRVRGVSGLRIIDSSIFPTLPSSNTNAAAIMTGEKGADLVLEAAN